MYGIRVKYDISWVASPIDCAPHLAVFESAVVGHTVAGGALCVTETASARLAVVPGHSGRPVVARHTRLAVDASSEVLQIGPDVREGTTRLGVEGGMGDRQVHGNMLK